MTVSLGQNLSGAMENDFEGQVLRTLFPKGYCSVCKIFWAISQSTRIKLVGKLLLVNANLPL